MYNATLLTYVQAVWETLIEVNPRTCVALIYIIYPTCQYL